MTKLNTVFVFLTLKCFQALCTCCCAGCIHYWLQLLVPLRLSHWISLLAPLDFTCHLLQDSYPKSACSCTIAGCWGFSQWFECKTYKALLWCIYEKVVCQLPYLHFQSVIQLEFECPKYFRCVGRRRCLARLRERTLQHTPKCCG